jgi:hypothetical protein
MKAKLKKLVGLAALGMTLVTSTVPTWAGRVSTDRVIIASNQAASWASGNLVDVRDSADTSREQIGCRAQTLSSYSWTSCHATDSAGRSLTCGSGEWKFLEMVHGMTDSSYIVFYTDNNGSVGTCTHIMIYDGSDMLK